MRKTPNTTGGSRAQDPPTKRAPAPVSGVRTEHQLRLQLKDALERNTKFERALRESVAFAYGRRELADLRRLKAVLWAAGFPDPSPRRTQSEDAEPDTPVTKHP